MILIEKVFLKINDQKVEMSMEEAKELYVYLDYFFRHPKTPCIPLFSKEVKYRGGEPWLT